MGLDGFQNAGSSLDGGIQEVFDWVLNVEMER